MPTAAGFEPIPPDLDLATLVESTDNFEYAPRIPCDMIDAHGAEQFEKLVLLHVILGGRPLVIEGFQSRLDRWTFSPQWLRDNVGQKFEHARDLTKGKNLPLSIKHYLNNMPMLTNQWTPSNYRTQKQRLYLKDIDCPEAWHEKLKEQIPPSLFYLNTHSGSTQSSVDEQTPNILSIHRTSGAAKAGDLMSALPPEMRAENMMCYIGHEGTYTPAHREMCASLGQNIMVEASGTIGEDGKETKPGSSIWFMTESKDRHLVSEYWLSTLGHDIEVETHFAEIPAWTQAPFKVYIVEQKAGDFILIPPLAPHQVWNRGTRTMKVAWNRTTVETLEMALDEALPRARLVCRDEQYKNKAIVLFSLNKYSALLKSVKHQIKISRDTEASAQWNTNSRIKELRKDFKKLFKLFNDILLSEMFAPHINEKKPEFLPFDSNVTCSYCRCNIFNRFLTCKACVIRLEDDSEDTYDVCMECYVMGRSCRCVSKLSWVEQFPWKDLSHKHSVWRQQILDMDNGVASKIPVPLPLEEERQKREIKPLAQICQEQLRLRPFHDPLKVRQSIRELNKESDSGQSDQESPRKKPKKRRSEKWLKEHLTCHICCWRHVKWKMAVCECGAAFCYGSLWRGFDTMPQSIMEDPYWRCPKCREICNCSSCRKRPFNEPYQPSGTVLGHDTRKFADTRSIEALVDFSFSNSHWIKKAGDNSHPTETRRMQKRISEAEHAKLQQPNIDDDDDDDYDDEKDQRDQPEAVMEFQDGRSSAVPIDPLLVDHEPGEPPGEDIVVNDSIQVAREVLSRLEQNPHNYMASAGLDGTGDGGGDEGVPTAPNDIHRETSEGKKISGNSKSAKVAKQNRSIPLQKRVDAEVSRSSDNANRCFSQSQVKKTMAVAKKTGRLIGARAAVTGDQLVIVLRLSPAQLARFGTGNEIVASASAIERDGTQSADARLHTQQTVRSDENLAKKQTTATTRKRLHDERDGKRSFRRDRRKKRVTMPPYRSSQEDGEATGNDDDSAASASESETRTLAPVPSKRTSLPANLARRGPVAVESLPEKPATVERRHVVPVAPMYPADALAAKLDQRAKLQALEDDLSSLSDDSLVAAPSTRHPGKAKLGHGHAEKHADSAPTPPLTKKPATLSHRSILNKSRDGKVRIVSSRAA